MIPAAFEYHALTSIGEATALLARLGEDAKVLKVAEDDLEWKPGKFSVKGGPGKSKTIQDIAFAAYTNHPQGMEAGLEAVSYYDPPNLTYPFGSYICVVDIDSGTGEVKVAGSSPSTTAATSPTP